MMLALVVTTWHATSTLATALAPSRVIVGDLDDLNNHTTSRLDTRSTGSGCVQARCIHDYANPWASAGPRDVTYVQVRVNGVYTFKLQTGSSGASEETYYYWDGVADHNGKKWDIKVKGNCGHLSYRNDWQTTDGWYGLGQTAYTYKQYVCTNEDSNLPKNCAYWETVQVDQYGSHCDSYATPSLCNGDIWCKSGVWKDESQMRFYYGHT
jgi:hypothetical protein